MTQEYLLLDDPKYYGVQIKLERVCKKRFPRGDWELKFAVDDPDEPNSYQVWFECKDTGNPLSLKVTKSVWESLLIS